MSVEKRNRIRVSLFAYAYEFMNDSLISDEEYDRLARTINTKESTGNKQLDDFFREYYTPDSGMWIRIHPELHKLNYLYKYYKNNCKII